MKDDLKPATTSLPPLEPWVWRLPEHFNIGVACTDAHLGTPAAQKIAMIVEVGTAMAPRFMVPSKAIG